MEEKTNEQLKKELWIKVWVAMSGDNNDITTCTKYADEAIKAFDERLSTNKFVYKVGN